MNLQRILKQIQTKQTKFESCHLQFEQGVQIQRCSKNIIYKSTFNKLSQLFMKQIF